MTLTKVSIHAEINNEGTIQLGYEFIKDGHANGDGYEATAQNWDEAAAILTAQITDTIKYCNEVKLF